MVRRGATHFWATLRRPEWKLHFFVQNAGIWKIAKALKQCNDINFVLLYTFHFQTFIIKKNDKKMAKMTNFFLILAFSTIFVSKLTCLVTLYNIWILAFFNNFCIIKIDKSGTTVWHLNFGIFQQFLSHKKWFVW